MTRVLGIDAGDMTGIAVVDFVDNGPKVLYLAQMTTSVVDTTYSVRAAHNTYRSDVVVIEQFNLRPGNQFVANLSTVYRNGAIEYMLAADFATEPVWQTPAQAKGLVSDTVLKRLGPDFWPTGKTVGQKDANDVRDALRHAIRYGVEVLQHLPTTKKGWPNR